MNYKILLIRLYYMLIHADGTIHPSEVQSGYQLINAEDIAEDEFTFQMQMLKFKDPAELLHECLLDLKKLDHAQQVRCVAWMCLIAGADGFMDRTEWQLIYNIYYKELNLPLDEILVEQKALSYANMGMSLVKVLK